jgi:hypothetical protein
MAMGYRKRKLSLVLPPELCEEIKKASLKMDWTEEEILGWAIAVGVGGIDRLGEMEEELSELTTRKKELDLELESIISDYGRLSTRNAALRYECFDTLTRNRTLAIKLTGAKTMNRSFKNVLKIADDRNEQEDRTDNEMVEKYVLNKE